MNVRIFARNCEIILIGSLFREDLYYCKYVWKMKFEPLVVSYKYFKMEHNRVAVMEHLLGYFQKVVVCFRR